MKKNGFTLLELLIGISLISIIMLFLFRLINDVQNEGLSNIYIVSNQTNRNEIISIVNKIMSDNGDICQVEVIDSVSNQTSLYFDFCNGKSISLIVSKDQIHISYNPEEYNYVMEDPRAFYDPAVDVGTLSYNGTNYVKVSIRTRKKGLNETTVDDIELMGKSRTTSVVRKTGTIAEYYADVTPHYFNVYHSPGDYRIEVWGAENKITNSFSRNGYYARATVHLEEGERLVISPGLAAALWTRCAGEDQTCTFSGTKNVAYGNEYGMAYLPVTDTVNCNNSTFGDPTPGRGKSCYFETEPYIPSIVSVTSSEALIPAPSDLSLLISAGVDGADISNARLTNSHITCLNCEPSQEEDPYVIQTTECTNSEPLADCVKTGSGFVRITKES